MSKAHVGSLRFWRSSYAIGYIHSRRVGFNLCYQLITSIAFTPAAPQNGVNPCAAQVRGPELLARDNIFEAQHAGRIGEGTT